MTLGPVQLLVIGLDGGEPDGELLAELERLRDSDVVRLIDHVAVRKDAAGNVEKLLRRDLSRDEAEAFGAVVGALIGFGAAGEAGTVDDQPLDEDVWYVEDAIPIGTAAVVALLEHRWAIPLRDGIRNAGGFHLADAWVHPADLADIGLIASEDAELQLEVS